MYDGGDISRHERIDRPHSASLSMNRAISHGQAGRSWAFRGWSISWRPPFRIARRLSPARNDDPPLPSRDCGIRHRHIWRPACPNPCGSRARTYRAPVSECRRQPHAYDPTPN